MSHGVKSVKKRHCQCVSVGQSTIVAVFWQGKAQKLHEHSWPDCDPQKWACANPLCRASLVSALPNAHQTGVQDPHAESPSTTKSITHLPF